MPAIIVWAMGLLAKVLAFTFGRLVWMLGVTVVTVTGVGTGLEWLKAEFIAAYSALPVTMLQVLSLLRIDQAVLLIFSAYAARLSLVGMDGVLRTMMLQPPQSGG